MEVVNARLQLEMFKNNLGTYDKLLETRLRALASF